MNKKIIISLGSAVLLASSLYAYGGDCNKTKMSCESKKCEKKISSKHNKKHHGKHHKKHRFVKTVMKLDLSDKQREDIRALIKENMKNRVNPNDAFSEKGFDKELFIKLSKQKRESKLQKRAELIESVYKILDDSQKAEFKKLLERKNSFKR